MRSFVHQHGFNDLSASSPAGSRRTILGIWQRNRRFLVLGG